jgi:hypothetical protein
MSDSMFAIGWLEMKQYDRAVSSFQKMFDHVAGDFQVVDLIILVVRFAQSIGNVYQCIQRWFFL